MQSGQFCCFSASTCSEPCKGRHRKKLQRTCLQIHCDPGTKDYVVVQKMRRGGVLQLKLVGEFTCLDFGLFKQPVSTARLLSVFAATRIHPMHLGQRHIANGVPRVLHIPSNQFRASGSSRSENFSHFKHTES